MITPEIIARINELARRQRAGSLTGAEQAEQAGLRRLYIEAIKKQVKVQLDGVTIRPDHGDDDQCDGQPQH